MIRLATENDIQAIVEIYNKIHKLEADGLTTIGWNPSIYPIRETAEDALKRNDLFVYELDNKIVASAIINQSQVPVYAQGQWTFLAADDDVMVLHTLTVDPDCAGKGIGRSFVAFYEEYAHGKGCHVLRLDTNAINSIARKMYANLGYRETDIVPCVFNGIPGVNLVLIEKIIE